MRNLPAGLTRSLKDGVTHFCHCWRLTRRDGKILGLTDHQRPLHFDKTDFHADAAIDVSAIDMQLGLHVPRPSVRGGLSHPLLSADDLTAGQFDEAAFELWLVDWQAPANRLLLLSGRFGNITRQGHGFSVRLRHHGAALRQTRGRIYQKTCDAALGDARCRAAIAAAPFTQSVTVLNVNGAALWVSETGDQADNWFAHGFGEAAGGAKCLIRSDRKTAKARALSLWQEAPADFQIGTRIKLVAGCDKRIATCRQKFSNAINYQGFPDLADDKVLIHVEAAHAE